MNKISKYFFRTILLLFVLANVITAFHAYKFTHFYDRDEFVQKEKADKNGWDIAKEVFFGINLVKRLNAPVEDSSVQTIQLVTKDELKIESWYIPTATQPKGTVILFHGHGGTKSGVVREASEFRNMGYNTMMPDFRAHGNSDGNSCTIGYHETEEVKLAYDFIQQKGEKNIVLWGISMGAAAISKAMVDYPLQPKKLILEMPFGSIVEATGGRITMMGVPAEPLATMITFWGGIEHGFWAFNMKPANFAKQINVPTLLQWGRHDARVSQVETDRIYANLPAKKRLVIYENSAHESLCKKENEKWLAEVSSFLAN
ncbi:MAG: alpha/beta hydrolase [Ferruginibacter sp.]|nr:alpha/beta hydrolase [Ferruginibacter sp.]